MCKFKSVVLLKTGDKVRLYHSPQSDSHAAIISANAEKFAGVADADFASVEILEDVIAIDESTKPEWAINYVIKHKKALFRFRAKHYNLKYAETIAHEKEREREKQRIKALVGENKFYAIANHFSFNKYTVKNISAVELAEIFMYRELAITLPEAKTKILEAIEKRNKKRAGRTGQTRPQPTDLREKIFAELKRRKDARASFINSLKTAQDPRSYKRFEYGKWYSSFKTFKVSDTVLAEIRWCEDTDWDYYSRRYGRPKNTFYGREVEFSVLGKTGVEKMSYTLDSFRGDFLEKAIKWFNEL